MRATKTKTALSSATAFLLYKALSSASTPPCPATSTEQGGAHAEFAGLFKLATHTGVNYVSRTTGKPYPFEFMVDGQCQEVRSRVASQCLAPKSTPRRRLPALASFRCRAIGLLSNCPRTCCVKFYLNARRHRCPCRSFIRTTATCPREFGCSSIG